VEKRVRSILFVAVLVGVGIVDLSRLPLAPSVLVREARRAADWPAWNPRELVDGTWTQKVEDAFADRFLGRERVTDLSAAWNRLRGLPNREAELVAAGPGGVYGEGAAAQGPPSPETLPSLAPAPESPPAAAPQAGEGAWVNHFLILGDRGFETAGYDDAGAAYYVAVLEELAASLGPSIPVYVVVVPSAIEFVEDERYRTVSYSQRRGIDAIYGKLSSRITAIDVYPDLAAHSREYVYHRTDPHWTGLGAWYAYRAAAPALGVDAYPYAAYPKAAIPGFLGAIYNATRAKQLEDNPDTEELVFPFAEHVLAVADDPTTAGKAVDPAYVVDANRYASYLGGDHALAVIRSTARSGRRILVVKDSFANAFIPYLIPHYEEIHIIDPRHWTGYLPGYVRDKGITEVMVFNYYLVVSVYTGFAQSLQRAVRAPAAASAPNAAEAPVSATTTAAPVNAPEPEPGAEAAQVLPVAEAPGAEEPAASAAETAPAPEAKGSDRNEPETADQASPPASPEPAAPSSETGTESPAP
jgi:hypothetical protein